MSATPNVLGIFPSFAPGEFGGVQASGRDAWDGMVEHVGAGRAHALCYEPETSKAETILRALRIRSCPDIILVWHLHLLKLLPFLQSNGARIVLFLHGIEVWRKHNPVMRSLLRRTHLMVTNSEYTWARFLECNPEMSGACHQTVHLGAGLPLNTEIAQPAGMPAALMIGRLCRNEDYKGHREMIQAWPLVVAREPGAELWIVGNPRMPTVPLHDAAGPNVRFVERFVTDPEVPAYFRRADLVVLPYREAEHSGVLFTALAFAKPLLLSDVGGLGELAAAGAARAVPAGDVEALRVGLKELLADPAERGRLGQAAADAAATAYSWDSIAERTMGLYRELLA